MRNSLKIIAAIFIIVISTPSVSAQTTKIAVAIAIQKSNCGYGSDDLGYQVMYGGDNSHYDLETKGKAKLKETSSYNNRISSTYAVSNNSKGDYLVIIIAKVPYSSCSTSVYGIGYGNNSIEATEDAVANLKTRNWSWSNSKHGYKIELKKQL